MKNTTREMPRSPRWYGLLTNSRSALLYCSLAALPTVAQINSPVAFSVASTADYSGTIAQGSQFIVFGENLGPAQLVPAASYPLSNRLGGTSITVMSGTAILDCPMVYSAAGVAAAILPSNTPIGRGSVSLTYNGQPTPFPVTINVVASAPGIYTSTSSGLGPGVFTTPDGILKTFAITAKPGDTVVAWATGLGPISAPDNVAPSTFPNFPGVEVFVGTQAATVVYAGRTACCAGVDQINFTVPAGVSGCYVPVVVSSGGMLSNFVSLAVNINGGPCSDTGPTIPVSVFNQAAAELPVKIAALAVGPISVLGGLGFDQRRDLAQRLSKLLSVTVASNDVKRLLRARLSHDQRAANHIMAKYAVAWKALTPAERAAFTRAVNLTQEGAVAAFGEYSTPATLAAAVGGLFPSQGTCTVANLGSQPSVVRSAAGLDAGPSLALTGQAGPWTLMPTTRELYGCWWRRPGRGCVQRQSHGQWQHRLVEQAGCHDRGSNAASDGHLVGRRTVRFGSHRRLFRVEHCRASGVPMFGGHQQRVVHDSKLHSLGPACFRRRYDVYRTPSVIAPGFDHGRGPRVFHRWQQ
jgi:uncharacterized protein (TIGR03437 family)